MVLIITNTPPQNLPSATSSETEWWTRTDCWSDGDSRIRKEKSGNWRQRRDWENWGSALIKTRGHSDDKMNPAVWSASSGPPAPDRLGQGLCLPPTALSLIPWAVQTPCFLQSVVSQLFPANILTTKQNKLCKAGASQPALVFPMLHSSTGLVKSVSGVSLLLLWADYKPREDAMCWTRSQSPTEMAPRDIFILI